MQKTDLATVHERNRHKRVVGWVLFYSVLIASFIFIVLWQANRVNTLGFASGRLQLTTSKIKYTVGDTVSYTLKNGLDHPITLVNTCPQAPLYAYSWTNNSWVRITDSAAASSCAGEQPTHTIPAGGSYSQNFANWPHLFAKPGIYRIVGLATNYTALPYTDFQVVAKPVSQQVQTRTQVIIQRVITPVYITVPSSGGDGGGGDN
jgi:plastocyanin